jgi:hypothetical protein
MTVTVETDVLILGAGPAGAGRDWHIMGGTAE